MRKSLLAATVLCGGVGSYYAIASRSEPEPSVRVEAVEQEASSVAQGSSEPAGGAPQPRAPRPVESAPLANDEDEAVQEPAAAVEPAATQASAEPKPSAEAAAQAFAATVAKAPSPEDARAIKQQKLQTRARAYDRMIDQGQPDPAWEGEVSNRMSAGLNMLFKGNAKLVDTNCSTEICRIQIGYENLETGARLMELLPAARSLLQAPAMMLAESGEQITMYMPKSGQEMPGFSADSIALANEQAATR